MTKIIHDYIRIQAAAILFDVLEKPLSVLVFILILLENRVFIVSPSNNMIECAFIMNTWLFCQKLTSHYLFSPFYHISKSICRPDPLDFVTPKTLLILPHFLL